MAATTPVCEFGWKAIDFSLPGVDGRTYSLADVTGTNGVLVMFICNHCPYVRAVADRIQREVEAVEALGFGAIAIMPNDTATYPQDDLEHMKAFAKAHGFTFPYVIDEPQQVSRAYGAACTPDFFGFNNRHELQYRGRLDASGRMPAAPDTRRELFEAMEAIAETGQGPAEQVASVGCSIKWKDTV